MPDYRVRIAIDRRVELTDVERLRDRHAPDWREQDVTTATLTFEQWQHVQCAIVEAFAMGVEPKGGA